MGLTGRTGGPESSAPPAAARVSTARGGRPAAAEAATRVEEEEESWSIVVELLEEFFFVLEVWSRAADTVTFFPLQQRRRERPPCAFPFLALQLIFFSRARTLDTAALVVVRQGIKTDKNNNKNETGKSPLLCVAVDSPLSISLPSFKAKK